MTTSFLRPFADSFNLWVPFSHLQSSFVDKLYLHNVTRFDSTVFLDNSTGRVVSVPDVEFFDEELNPRLVPDFRIELVPNSSDDSNDGTFISCKQCTANFDRVARDYLVVAVTSKLLLERYFDGITSDSFGLLIDNLNKLRPDVFCINRRDALSFRISDIDIACDFYINNVREFSQTFKDYCIRPEHFVLYSGNAKSGDTGFNFVHRGIKQYPTVKLYSKLSELEINHPLFLERYCSYFPPLSNYCRFEVSFKSLKFIRKFKLFGINTPKMHCIVSNLLDSLDNGAVLSSLALVEQEYFNGVMFMTNYTSNLQSLNSIKGNAPSDKVLRDLFTRYKLFFIDYSTSVPFETWLSTEVSIIHKNYSSYVKRLFTAIHNGVEFEGIGRLSPVSSFITPFSE